MASRPLELFDQEIRQRKLEGLGDALMELDRIVPWGVFRETLEAIASAPGGWRVKVLFAELNAFIDLAGFQARMGQMIDARIAEAQDPPTGGAQGRRAGTGLPAGDRSGRVG